VIKLMGRKQDAKPKISIITVNIDSPEWARLLIESIRKYTTVDYEIIVVDNGSLCMNLFWLEAQKDILLWKLGKNVGHGTGMDMGTQVAKAPYVCILDIDSHIMRPKWAEDLIALYESDPQVKLIGCVGPDHKPLHPPLFFFEKSFILQNGISFKYVPDVSTDTAQKAYHDIVGMGYKVHRLEKGEKEYGLIGDEIHLNGQSTIYHHWYGTRFCENNPHRKKQELDGYTLERHLEEKAKLYFIPQVQELLGLNIRMAKRAQAFKDYMICRDLMLINNEQPWIEPSATDFLKQNLKKDMTVLEIGAGSSTIWLAKRVAKVVSFENNPVWYNVIHDELSAQGLTDNVDLNYCPDYHINELPKIPGDFDIVFVDGPTEGREKVIKQLIGKAKRLFVVDDTQRVELYQEGFDLLDSKGWPRHDFHDGPGPRMTSIWAVR